MGASEQTGIGRTDVPPFHGMAASLAKENTMQRNHAMTPSLPPVKHALFFLAPSWLIAGTIRSQNGDIYTLDDAAWLEIVGAGRSMFDIATATSAKELGEIVTASWGLPNGTTLTRPTIVVPLLRDVRPLARAKDAKTIKDATES